MNYRDHPLSIHPSMIEGWRRELASMNREQVDDLRALCAYQRKSWMASARKTKSLGVRPWSELNMAWKYHRHLLMLLRERRVATEPPTRLVQATLFSM